MERMWRKPVFGWCGKTLVMGTKTSLEHETFWGATQYTGRAGVRDSIRHLEDAMQTNKRPAQGGLYIHFGGAKGEQGGRRRRG